MSFGETQNDVDGDLDATAPAGSYAVKLPVFEGPLDLLLHLIRQNEVEITDIPIAHIGKQYLEYLELMEELNLDVAAEYLVMAATLAYIKSRMLLPPIEEEGDEDEIDPHAELVARLLEYQRFKEVAEALGKRRLLERDVFDARGLEPESVPEGEREIEVGLFELIEAFREMLEQAPEEETIHRVESEEITVRDRMIVIMETLSRHDSIEFTQLFALADGGHATRAVLVASFLGILELARLQALSLYQGVDGEGAPEGAIRLRAVERADEIAWEDRITDLM
jgi:segregation and condensation protein A